MQIIVRTDGIIAKFAGMIDAAAPQAKRAFREGLKEGGEKTRTQVRVALVAQMGVIRPRVVNQNTAGTLAAGGELSYVIRGTGKGLPIENFRISSKGRKRFGDWRDQPRVARGRFGSIPGKDKGTVTAAPWAVSRTFKRSFNQVGRGPVARRGAEGGLRSLFGPAVSKELVKGQSASTFMSMAAPTVEAAVMKRLARVFP